MSLEEESEMSMYGLTDCTLDMFREYARVKQMFSDIPHVTEKTATAVLTPNLQTGDSVQFTAEKAFEDIKTVLDQYQEQPHLLDPNLEELLGILVSFIREAGPGSEGNSGDEFYQDTKAPRKAVAAQAFKYLYMLVKVRGYKVIVNKLPHEVSDLIPILEMVEQPADDRTNFYNNYILLLWLSIIVYMPFNIADFDATTTTGGSDESSAGKTVVERLLGVIECHLSSPQASRDMAAFLASKLVTRPDLREKQLPQFVNSCLMTIETRSREGDTGGSTFHRLGCLRSLGLIWKHGRREELLPLSVPVLTKLLELKSTSSSDAMIRKLSIKLVQRIGLTFLPPRVATWRYHRGNRSLLINMQGPSTEGDQEGKSSQPQNTDDEDIEVPPEMDDVIDELLKGLKDTDTVVRWSSSKGVGRVCGRLGSVMAGEVVSAVLSSFTPLDTHSAWHGGCLTLAELGRRGLLLPHSFPEVVSVLQRGFVYDQLMGQCSVGANIRDAACYLCWSLARAYDPETLAPYVGKLATGLLIVALFDREIPCRHAAAAAFQEHVGRQGNFPHGIAILTTVDYFAVGIRANAYLKLAPYVASYPEYSSALVDHLVTHKLTHWDTVVRQLAAKTLLLLVPHCPDHCASDAVLRTLLTAATGAVLVERHGAILAIGNVLAGLAGVAKEKQLPYTHYIREEVLSSMHGICGALAGRQLLQGVGGSYMRLAIAEMVHHVASAAIHIPRQYTDEWLKLLEDSSLFIEEDVRTAAVKGLSALWKQYYSDTCSPAAAPASNSDQNNPTTSADKDTDMADSDTSQAASADGSDASDLSSATIGRYLATLGSDKESHAHGMAVALGSLPRGLLQTHNVAVIHGLLKATIITPATTAWAATRRDAVNSILTVVNTLGLRDVGQELYDECLEMLQRSLDDYTVDRRGDVGAWVREAAITVLQNLLTRSVSKENGESESLVTARAEDVSGIMTRIVRLTVERIDKTRRVAGIALAAIIHHSPAIPNIPHHDELRMNILPSSFCSNVNWSSDKETFGPISKLLHKPPYAERLLLGFAYSLGGVSANLALNSSSALDTYVLSVCEDPKRVAAFIDSLLLALQKCQDRLALPLLKTFEHLITTSTMMDQSLEADPALADRLVSALRSICRGCQDYHKLVTISACLSELIRLNSPVTTSVLTQLFLFLGYQYPKVRTMTATSLVTALQDYSEDLLVRGIIPSQKALDTLLEILEVTTWMEASLAEVREKRNICCTELGLPIPTIKKKP